MPNLPEDFEAGDVEVAYPDEKFYEELAEFYGNSDCPLEELKDK